MRVIPYQAIWNKDKIAVQLIINIPKSEYLLHLYKMYFYPLMIKDQYICNITDKK